jgi:hypothetical protein
LEGIFTFRKIGMAANIWLLAQTFVVILAIFQINIVHLCIIKSKS